MYKYYEDANNPLKREEDSSKISWYSFSKPDIDKLLSLDIPIYLTYGTEDIVSDLCDLLPLYFIRENKNNLTLKRQLKLEHNFFEVQNGKVDHSKPHWKEVMRDFLNWTLTSQ